MLIWTILNRLCCLKWPIKKPSKGAQVKIGKTRAAEKPLGPLSKTAKRCLKSRDG